MKRLRVALVAAALLLGAGLARADVGSAETIINGATVDTSVERNVSKAASVGIQVWNTAGGSAVAVVTIYGRACPGTGVTTCAAPWFPLLTVNNPDARGEYWSVAQTMRLKAEVSGYLSGTIFVVLETHSVSP